MARGTCGIDFSRPFGTRPMELDTYPNVETLGYCRLSLRDEDTTLYYNPGIDVGKVTVAHLSGRPNILFRTAPNPCANAIAILGLQYRHRRGAGSFVGTIAG